MENVNTIDKRRSKIVRNRVFDCHLLPNDFDPHLLIVKSVFGRPLSAVDHVTSDISMRYDINDLMLY